MKRGRGDGTGGLTAVRTPTNRTARQTWRRAFPGAPQHCRRCHESQPVVVRHFAPLVPGDASEAPRPSSVPKRSTTPPIRVRFGSLGGRLEPSNFGSEVSPRRLEPSNFGSEVSPRRLEPSKVASEASGEGGAPRCDGAVAQNEAPRWEPEGLGTRALFSTSAARRGSRRPRAVGCRGRRRGRRRRAPRRRRRTSTASRGDGKRA